MSGLGIAAIVAVGMCGWVVGGLVVGATMFRRRSALWKSLNSNLGEFVMQAGTIGLLVYLVVWPIWVAVAIVEHIRHKRIV